MAKLLSLVVLFGISGFSQSETLKSRVDFLEMQVSREAFKTKSDIIELREQIAYINKTKSLGAPKTADTSDIEVRMEHLEESVKQFIDIQYEKTIVLSKAIQGEKALTRKMLKIIRDLADSNTESVLEIEEALKQNEIGRELFEEEWKLFQNEIKGELNEVKNNSKVLNDKLKNFDGNIIIHNANKKTACPEAWTRDKNTCYLYQKQEKLSWYGARIRCHDLGGNLAEPDTEEKMRYILSAIDDNNVWIGATDEDNEGTWVWASSQKQLGSYIQWQQSQPNNLFGNQHCMEIGLSLVNDESCFEDNYYVCEKPVTE